MAARKPNKQSAVRPRKAAVPPRRSCDLAADLEDLSDSILDSLVSNVAVVNSDGTILATNKAWNRFARDNGNPPPDAVSAGANYLEVCRQAAANGDPEAKFAMEGICGVLRGVRSSFHLEYPCLAGNEERWFVMDVAPLKGADRGAVIIHSDITDRKVAELAAQTSESMIHALLAAAPQSVVAMGEDEKIVFINGNVKDMFGYTKEELLGKPLEVLIPERHWELPTANHKAQLASTQKGNGLSIEARRKDGSLFPVEIGLGAVQTASGKLAVAFVSDITQRRQMEQIAQARAEEVRALAASLLTAQEEERRRVSRELHDQICQQLASLAIEMGGLVADEAISTRMQSRLKALQARIVRASEETRHIAYELHPSVLDDLGLVASLRDLIHEFSKETKIAVKFTHNALPASLPREIASCLYRVARESLQNIKKHANPKNIGVALTLRKDTIVLTIADDGVGFDMAAITARGGLGLIGMQERARLVNGKLAIDSRPGFGVRIGLEIPLDQ